MSLLGHRADHEGICCKPQRCSTLKSMAMCVRHAGVGTVVKSASGKFNEGQRVVSAGKWNGSWQEYALADESSLVRHSPSIWSCLTPAQMTDMDQIF
jgi:NADPH:quinone reductase-like Zn-dependent oxidoreductase